MYLAPIEHRCSDACYHDTYSTYRLEIPERRQSKKGKLGTKLMKVITLPRMRMRMPSPALVFEKMRDSYLRLVISHKKPEAVSNGGPLYHHYHQSSYPSDAVADCIEFIKRSSSCVSHDDAEFL